MNERSPKVLVTFIILVVIVVLFVVAAALISYGVNSEGSLLM